MRQRLSDAGTDMAVSYTHLDVYKRQVLDNAVGVELTELREHQGVGVLNDSVFLAGGGDGNGYHRAPVFCVRCV